jgi:hypothetical protein
MKFPKENLSAQKPKKTAKNIKILGAPLLNFVIKYTIIMKNIAENSMSPIAIIIGLLLHLKTYRISYMTPKIMPAQINTINKGAWREVSNNFI